MSKLTSGKTSQIAEKFAKNWKEQRLNMENTEDGPGELDDSLTNLQWLHNITVLDITPANLTSSPSSSPRSSEDDLTETWSEKSEPEVLKEDNKIDYMSDPNRKPPYSYATLICMAMRDTKKSKITLSAIYKWIRENFVYYRHADPTWQVWYILYIFLLNI
jgi:forkhead box protein J1